MFFKKYRRRIENLEARVCQLECDHSFRFAKSGEDMWFGTLYRWIQYKCKMCSKSMLKFWGDLSKQEQQAAKVLKVVPADWPIKTEGGK